MGGGGDEGGKGWRRRAMVRRGELEGTCVEGRGHVDAHGCEGPVRIEEESAEVLLMIAG